ncbi:MAG: hypothetical protein Alpg2KO_06940 [Alphaproteobacteria bacterium]
MRGMIHAALAAVFVWAASGSIARADPVDTAANGKVVPEQAKCFEVKAFRAGLARHLRLFSIGRGLNAKGNVTELWVGARDRGWMLVVLTPDGRACPLDYGPDWQRSHPRMSCAGGAVGP